MPPTPPSRRAPTRGLLIVPPLVLAAGVFHPIIRNFFYADDFLHLYQFANGDPVRFLLFPHGGHLCLVRNALFFVTASVFGAEPAGYLWTALLTHLVNVALLFLVLRACSGSPHLACLGASLWGISPLHEEPLGWYSVYGHVVATTLVLSVLLDASRHIGRGAPLTPRRAWLWVGLMTTASNSFGTAIGVACVFPLVIWLMGVPGAATRSMHLRLWTLPIVVLGLYAATLAAYAALYGRPDTALSPRIAVAGGGWPIVAMLGHLFGAGITGLFVPAGLTRRIYPGPLALGLIGLVLATVLWAWRRVPAADRRRMLAFLLVAGGGYAMVALGRAAFYLINQQPLAWAATAFRYHYLPSVGMILFLGTVVGRSSELPLMRGHVNDALTAAALAGLVVLFVVRGRPVDHHPTARAEITAFRAAIHARASMVPVGETAYLENRPFPLVLPLTPAAEFPGWAALFVIFFPTNTVDGRPVRFLAQDEATLAATRAGGRIAEVLVPRPAAP